MEIETLCTESILDQRHDHTAEYIGRIQTWNEHHCRWLDKGAAEGKAERSTRPATAARCDQVVHDD
eukprot:11853247-Prorocentrum_lima.AAC.1